MNWLNRVVHRWRVFDRRAWLGVPIRGRKRRRRTLRAMFDQLETRLAPAITFDPASGLLTVMGDQSGPRDDVIDVSVVRSDRSSERSEFIVVTINGEVHSSKPGTKRFDPALTGATRTSVRSIDMQGLEGNDKLRLRGGFRNADEHVTLNGGAGADSLFGSSLAEVLLGGAGADFIDGGRGDDFVEGGSADDSLLGGAGDDTLVGGGGTDNLEGGQGVNELIEGGSHSISFESRRGQLSVTGGRSDDVITLSLTPEGFVQVEINEFLLSSDPSSLNFDSVLAGATSATVNWVLLQGLDGDDKLTVLDAFPAPNGAFLHGPVTMEGGIGNDTLNGSPRADSLIGGAGDDLLEGADGNDVLSGQLGDDTLDAGAGEFGIVHEEGNVDFVLTDDRLTGLGVDLLIGMTRAELFGGNGDNTLDASAFTLGPVTLGGGAAGDDLLIGSPSGDALYGGGGNDTLVGGDGSDYLAGGDDSDSLVGGAGDDLLDDDFRIASVDTLVGGSGRDEVYQSLIDYQRPELGPEADELVLDSEDDVVLVGRGDFFSGHHSVGGHQIVGEPCHFIGCLADGHHIAWPDRDISTPNVIDIWYDFRAETNPNTMVTYTNLITDGQKLRAVDALDLWETASNNAINFIQKTTTALNNIINIGTGNLAAFGGTSGMIGVLGLGGFRNIDQQTHTPIGGAAWMDSAETWDETIGNENPDQGLDWYTVAVQEIGHALGIDHLDDLAGLDMMDVAYTVEQTTTSANDNRHMRIVYGGELEIDAGPSDVNDMEADEFTITRTGNTLEIKKNGKVAFYGDARPVSKITINGSNDADTLKLDYTLASSTYIDRPITFNAGAGVDRFVALVNADQTLTTVQYTNSIGTVTLDTVTLSDVQEAILTGGDFNNLIDALGFSGPVTLDGGAGNDTLKSGSGNDSLTGGAGSDSLLGGLGNDTYAFGNATVSESDVVTGNSLVPRPRSGAGGHANPSQAAGEPCRVGSVSRLACVTPCGFWRPIRGLVKWRVGLPKNAQQRTAGNGRLRGACRIGGENQAENSFGRQRQSHADGHRVAVTGRRRGSAAPRAAGGCSVGRRCRSAAGRVASPSPAAS